MPKKPKPTKAERAAFEAQFGDDTDAMEREIERLERESRAASAEADALEALWKARRKAN